MDLLVIYIGLLGSFALAISGSLTAMEKKFDIFGVVTIAFVTAVGGGTLRDVLLSERSVFWFEEVNYLYVILIGTLLAIVFRKRLSKASKALFLFDTLGLGLYTITGVQIGLEYELNHINCMILGTITGSFGGVLRDILVNEVPVIFKKEIYATVCIAGGGLYLILYYQGVPDPYLQICSALFIIIIRIIVVYFKISLPSIYSNDS